MAYLDHVRRLNRYNPRNFRPFRVDGVAVGEIKHGFAGHLAHWPTVFRVDDDGVDLAPALRGFEARTEAVARVTEASVESGAVQRRHGEYFPVTAGERHDALFLVDRGAAPYFGVRAFGQHLNGYVHGPGGLNLWIARRAMSRWNAPGKLDNLVAGGLPWGLSLEDNLAKECWEEAGIPADLASRARPVGHISYRTETDYGLKPDVMYCYDLELPADFQPRCTDGEVEDFLLLPATEVARLVRDTTEFKLNCNLVIIDFLVRHGVISTRDPEYAQVVAGLRR